MEGRTACAIAVALVIACGSSAPEDADYPPLPDRHANGGGAPKSSVLEAADASDPKWFEAEEVDASLPVDAGPAPVDAAIEAAIDSGACADGVFEIEPNDFGPTPLAFGKTCGAIDAKDVDRFFFQPSQATTISFSAHDLAFFYVGDFAGAEEYALGPGQAITVGPDAGYWYVVAAGPRVTSYEIRLAHAP